MSEAGWKTFLAAEGVDDWVVLHGGATAAFRVGSLGEAAELAQTIAQVPGLDGSGALLTIAADRVTVRLTRGVFRIEPEHVELAHAVSAVARSRGVVADRSAVQEVQVAISAKPDDIDIAFWRAVLGYDPLAEDNAVDPLGHGSTVWMQELSPAKPLRHAMHVRRFRGPRACGHARGGRPGRGGIARGRRRCAGRLDPRGPRRQQGLHRHLAGRREAARPVTIGGLVPSELLRRCCAESRRWSISVDAAEEPRRRLTEGAGRGAMHESRRLADSRTLWHT